MIKVCVVTIVLAVLLFAIAEDGYKESSQKSLVVERDQLF